jgi:photosystem II stability/assembly factor-like uncharacterized protein
MDIAVAPEDHEIVYAATSNYGVIKTLDSGSSWQQINQGLVMTQGASAVAVHPSNSQIVYAGVAFGGVYRSEDGGESWQQISAGLNPEANISDLVIDPTDPDVLYTSDHFSGVYRSLNGGETWMKFSDNLRMRAVNQLALTANGQHLYAATEGEGVYRIDLSGEPPEAVVLEESAPQANGVEESEETKEPAPQAEAEEQSQEKPEETETTDQPAEIDKQVCPGSYLPLVMGLVSLGFWKKRKIQA